MFSRRFPAIFVILTIILLVISPSMVRAGDTGSDDDPEDGCTGSWVFPPQYVGGDDGVVFAHVSYEFDENCEPVLVEQIRLNYVPALVTDGEQEPFETKTVPIIPPPPSDMDEKEGGSGIDAVDTCHLRTWEEDVIGLDMIAVQVDQTYSWNGRTVTLSSGSVSAATYYYWWYISSGPSGSSGYYSSRVAYANGQASFYCNGGPFCGGGPAYHITLYDYMTVDYQGGCGGYCTYSGTVVPFGRVSYNYWK